jgi:hypothetical protein
MTSPPTTHARPRDAHGRELRVGHSVRIRSADSIRFPIDTVSAILDDRYVALATSGGRWPADYLERVDLQEKAAEIASLPSKEILAPHTTRPRRYPDPLLRLLARAGNAMLAVRTPSPNHPDTNRRVQILAGDGHVLAEYAAPTLEQAAEALLETVDPDKIREHARIAALEAASARQHAAATEARAAHWTHAAQRLADQEDQER